MLVPWGTRDPPRSSAGHWYRSGNRPLEVGTQFEGTVISARLPLKVWDTYGLTCVLSRV